MEAEKAANTLVQDIKPQRPDDAKGSIDGTPHTRRDLAGALRSNGHLQSRLKLAEAELVKLKAKTRSDNKLVEELSKERTILGQKVKDRDEELQGKAKLFNVWRTGTFSMPTMLTCFRMSRMK